MNKTSSCVYEKIILFKKVPYWLYYPLVGLCGFLVGDVLLRLYGEKRYIWTQVILALYLGISPVIVIRSFYSFLKIFKELSPILWEQDDEFESWVNNRTKRIFSLDSFPFKIFTSFIYVGTIYTLILIGFPFKSQIVNSLMTIYYLIVVFVCAQNAYLLLDLLITLREVVQRPPKMPFFLFSHPAISKLRDYYFRSAICVTVGYIFLFLCLLYGPWGISFEFQLWLTVLAFYPISMFSWTFFQVNNLMKNIKISHVETINDSLQPMVEKISSKSKKNDLKKLEKIMCIQTKVQAASARTFDLQGAVTFIITLATAIVQLISIINASNP